MNYHEIAKMPLFKNIPEENIASVLQCFDTRIRSYEKDTIIYATGTYVAFLGLVLSGSVHISQTNFWGNQNIFGHLGSGHVFGETYASTAEPMMVDVVATTACEILFLKVDKLLHPCDCVCSFHRQLMNNFISIMAAKNMDLTQKISHTSPKSIRERLLSYLSAEAISHSSTTFEIPFNRQQMADYLCVDRSALSNELGKMRDAGLLSFHKNKFTLYEKHLK